MDFEKQALSITLIFAALFIASLMLVILDSFQAAAIAFVMMIFLAIAFKYPRIGLWVFLIYLPFSGTITYSIGNVYQAVGSSVAYNREYFLFHLAKDALYISALFAIVFSRDFFTKILPKLKPFAIAVVFLLLTSLLTLIIVNIPQELNSSDREHPLLMGIIGLKVLIGYIPLTVCAYFAIGDRKDFFFLNRLQGILILICCSLCFVQYFLLLTNICPGNINLTGRAIRQATLQARCFFGGSLLYNPELGLIRLPGTFVSPWHWGWFLISSTFFSYALSFSDPKRIWRMVGWTSNGLLLSTAVISGQRIALILVPVIFLILLILTEKNKQQLAIKLAIIFVVGIFVANHLPIVENRIDRFIDRWNYTPPLEFIKTQFKWVINHQLEWLGNGLGKATSGARRFGSIKLIETYYPMILYEVGILGVIAFLTVVSTLTAITFQAYRSIKNKFLRRWSICIWVFILFISYNTYYYPLAVDPVAVYYWFFAGVLLKLPELDLQVSLVEVKQSQEI